MNVPNMPLQVTRDRKGAIAKRTTIRLLASMSSQMSREISRSGKRLATISTNMLVLAFNTIMMIVARILH